MLLTAGAAFPSDSRAENGGTIAGSTWLYDITVDYFVSIRVGYAVGGSWFGGTMTQEIADEVLSQFNLTKAYKAGNCCLLCGELATPVRIAYAAEAMYPEVFGNGYADNYNQQFCDMLFGAGTYDISKLTFIYRNTVPAA